MSHLSRDRVIDAVEGRLDPHIDRHLSICPRCRQDVESLRATLREVRAVEVPEPSPLFWDHLLLRVREAIATEPSPQRIAGWTQAFRRPLAAILAVLLVVSAVALLTPLRWDGAGVPEAEPPLPASTKSASTKSASTKPASTKKVQESMAPAELASGDGWQFVVDAADVADWESVRASGFDTPPGAADLVTSELSPDERRELVKLLHEALAASAGAARRPKGDV